MLSEGFKKQSEYLGISAQDSIYSNNDKDFFHRSAISRIYYSVFHLSLEQTQKDGWLISTGEGSDHENVIRCIKEVYYKPKINIEGNTKLHLSQILRQIKNKRTTSDYKAMTQAPLYQLWIESELLYSKFKIHFSSVPNRKGTKPIIWVKTREEKDDKALETRIQIVKGQMRFKRR